LFENVTQGLLTQGLFQLKSYLMFL